MTKDEAVELLKEKGLNASLKDGSVMVESPDFKDCEKMHKILKKAGYNATCGWKMTHEG